MQMLVFLERLVRSRLALLQKMMMNKVETCSMLKTFFSGLSVEFFFVLLQQRLEVVMSRCQIIIR